MATNNNQNGWLTGLNIGIGGPLTVVPEQQQSGTTSEMNQFEQIDRNATASNTLKRNPKMELTKTDLLKLVTCFEGEIQARDIAIAALKSEKLKQVVNLGRYRPAVMSDPYTALLRDTIADTPSSKLPYSEKEMQEAADAQIQALEQLAMQQRRAHQHMVNILKDAEAKHKKVIQELEEEKCKHEHDTAQGDDITYGLEMERSRLKQELEVEKLTRKKMEKEVKRQQELADEERARQKQIVLLLLGDRKRVIIKYIEERRRSEDLAQILSEEKARIDSMAEGLEEESKKSLRMEAELEKQLHLFDSERKALKSSLSTAELKCQELEGELQKLRTLYEDVLRTRARDPGDTAVPMTSSVAKAVQPTATVSSVPVSGPTTGIAQSVTPGQALRQTAVAPVIPALKGTASAVVIPSVQSQSSRTSSSSKQSTFHSQIQSNVAPATPPKKGMVASRGVPPPIPPNKPVIPTKQSSSRRPESSELEKKKQAAPPSAGKDGKDSASEGGGGGRSAASGIEMLVGQELADYQQVFVTMATSNST
nr:uncharacterized protein CG10915 [Onthophagus taurus]